MDKEKNMIHQNDDPEKGPLDGIQLRTNCIRTKFTKKLQRTGYPFKQMHTEAKVSASMEAGTFAIRDMQTGTMLIIRIEDAMAVCAAAAEANRRMDECAETKESAEVVVKESDS